MSIAITAIPSSGQNDKPLPCEVGNDSDLKDFLKDADSSGKILGQEKERKRGAYEFQNDGKCTTDGFIGTGMILNHSSLGPAETAGNAADQMLDDVGECDI